MSSPVEVVILGLVIERNAKVLTTQTGAAHLSLTPGEGAVALTTEDGVELSIPPSIVLRHKEG